MVNKEEIPYLQGIADGGGGGSDEAKKLINLIKKYGEIELSLQG